MTDEPAFDLAPPAPHLRLVEASPQVRDWRAGLALLSESKDPCLGYRHGEWAKVLATMHATLDRFGDELARHGWTTEELFSVHPTAGIKLLPRCGALVSKGAPPDAVSADTMTFGRLTHRRGKLGWEPGVLVWEWKAPVGKGKGAGGRAANG